jgi:hypothetical protein
MRMKRLVVIVVSLVATVFLVTSGWAASMTGTISEQKLVGPYRLILRIGPPEKMLMHRQMGNGELMLGGKMAMCRMGKMGHMAATAPEAMGKKTCNHHLELHVFDRHTGRVVTHAHVVIMLRDMRNGMTIMVPIMTMMGVHAGMKDYHYGNNIYAAPGSYTVMVQVNGIHAIFQVRLM